jgi:hypothetical protein
VTARAWHGAIALAVLLALAMQIWIAVDVPAHPPGHAVGMLAGTALPWRIVRTFSFFTVQSNVVSGVVSWQLARRPAHDGARWRIARLDALFGIAVTGIVYSTVLAKIHEPHGGLQIASNTIVHYVVPILMVLGWLMFGPRPRITRTVVLRSVVWPVAWFAYTLVAGAISHWYPYPFADAATHGYGPVLRNSAAVTAVLAVVAAVFWLGDHRLRRAPSTSD